MTKAKIDTEGWCRCGKCGHKLFRLVEEMYPSMEIPLIEIKCHSCKAVNVAWKDKEVARM